MEYIVLDMEWNQALNFSEMVKDPVFLTGEIIQIGAIKLNQTLEVVDSLRCILRVSTLRRDRLGRKLDPKDGYKSPVSITVQRWTRIPY